MDSETESVGSIEEIKQAEEGEEIHMRNVPVEVDGPVQVQFLPARSVSMRSIAVTTSAQVLLPEDPRRSRAVILPVDGDVYIGSTSAAVGGSTPFGFRIPASIPVDLAHQDQVFIASVTGTVVVSVMVENWAD